MCWWGESALVVASRLKHGFILLLYSRKHLDAQSLLLPPIRLPVGMRPLFMQVCCLCNFCTIYGFIVETNKTLHVFDTAIGRFLLLIHPWLKRKSIPLFSYLNVLYSQRLICFCTCSACGRATLSSSPGAFEEVPS